MNGTATVLAAPGERASWPARIACLCAVLLVFVAFRLALLEWSFEAVFTPGYETLPVGTLAAELVTGLPSLGVFEFHDTHSGGQILSSLLTAVSFKLFGPTYWALKLAPTFFAAVTLALLFLFFERWYGLRAALLGSALWIAAPSTYVDYSSANYGNHSEVLVFVALTLFPIWRRFVDGDTSAKTYTLLGLTCGLAVWYSLSSLLLLVLYLGVWFVLERNFFAKKSFVWFVIGLAVGMLPVWYVMATYDAPQAEWMENKFAAEGVGLLTTQTTNRLWEFWSTLWFRSPCFYSFGVLEGRALSAVYAGFWLCAMLWLAWLGRGVIVRFVKRALFLTRESIDGHTAVLVAFLAYPFALAMAYAGSNFKIGNWVAFEWGGYRYCITAFFVLNVLFVVSWRELRARGKAWLANGLMSVVLAIGILGNAGHPFSSESAGIGRKYDGFDYIHMGRLFLVDRWTQRGPEPIYAAITGLEPWKRYQILQGIGCVKTLVQLRDDEGVMAPSMFAASSFFHPWAVSAVPRGCVQALAEGAGMALARFHSNDLQQMFDGIMAVKGGERRFFIHGVFVPGDYLGSQAIKWRTAANLRLMRKIDDETTRAYAVEALGMYAGFIAWRELPQEDEYIQQVFDFVTTLKNEEKESFVRGFGLSCLRYFRDPDHYDVLITKWIPPGGLGPAYCGIGMVADLVWQYRANDIVAHATDLMMSYRNDVAEGLVWRDASGKPNKPKAPPQGPKEKPGGQKASPGVPASDGK